MSTLNILKNARKKVISKAVEAKSLNNIHEKINWELRRAYLDRKTEYFNILSEKTKIPKTVFISYSVDTGTPYYEHLKSKLENEGFEILHGFKRVENSEGNVITRVINNLKKSTIYLGILTRDMEIKDHNKQTYWSPSVWTMEEKGMAIGLEKPFILVIDSAVHEHYWKKTAANKQQVVFYSDHDFYNLKAQLAIQEINDRYEEYAIKFLEKNF